MSSNRQVTTEGFPEVLGDQLYERIRSLSGGQNSGYRKKFEYGLPPEACAGGNIPSSQ